MYRVIETFRDLRDGCLYLTGDPYPRNGAKVSEERLAELAGIANRQHRPLIRLEQEAPTEEKPARKRATRKKKE